MKDERLASVDEYLEKTAAKWSDVAAAAMAALKNLRRPAVYIPVGLGAGALGTVGAWQMMGGDRPGETLSYRVNRALHSLTDRIRADEQFGEAFAKEIGSSSAKNLIGLTKDIVTKGYESMKDSFMVSPVRKQIFETLKREDETLSGADNKTLLEAYHTMSRFAPTLSTDKNTVKAFLRVAATSPEGGVDYNTIKTLAEAENAVQGPKSKD